MSQPFGATNKPGTCKWCGRKLRQKYSTKTESVERERTKCCNAAFDVDGPYGLPRCTECGEYATKHKSKVVERVKRYEQPGDYGDGHFCGLNCGYLFAVICARDGSTLKPKK